ncbi:hypothetical protein MRX96_006491 [Rhipicephalus microplus]
MTDGSSPRVPRHDDAVSEVTTRRSTCAGCVFRRGSCQELLLTPTGDDSEPLPSRVAFIPGSNLPDAILLGVDRGVALWLSLPPAPRYKVPTRVREKRPTTATTAPREMLAFVSEAIRSAV